MAIAFNKLKNPKLGLTDTIGFGKLKGCRVCDVIEDQYEYLLWAEKSGYVKFQDAVSEAIKRLATYEDEQRHYTEEVAVYTQDILEQSGVSEVTFDDVPF